MWVIHILFVHIVVKEQNVEEQVQVDFCATSSNLNTTTYIIEYKYNIFIFSP